MSKGPEHIAIIMDGNGRWAKERGLPRFEGHRRGASVIRKIVNHAKERGVKILTLYAFSTENWARPLTEVSLLMGLLKAYAAKERADMMKDNIRLRVIGDVSRLHESAREELLKTVEATKECTGIVLQLALSYSGRDEIIRAINQYRSDPSPKSEPLTAERFESFLDTAGQVNPELIIRTSGEMRLSNFMIWQAAYSEFYVSEVYWPDFSELEFDRALDAYAQRDRRFGTISSLSQTGTSELQ